MKDFYQISLKLILKNQAGEALCLKGLRGGTFDGFYDLPGGRIDDSEFTVPFEQVIKREVAEELGQIDFIVRPKPVALGRHLIISKKDGTTKNIHVLYVFFEAKYKFGTLKISKEHEGFIWLNLKDINLEDYFTSGILQGIKMYLN
ncbi:MAG: NUDIX domain-containing protein [Patescibacteria group bacterium]